MELSLQRGSSFALVVSGIMVAEQVLLNAAVLTVDATSASRVLAGVVFNILLIARAPLQLFQAIQTSLLPHLTGLEVAPRAGMVRRCVCEGERRLMPKNRLEAFSDGVIAVAVTLLALGLPIPEAARTPDLARTLGHHWPNFAAFAVSFITIGIIWINHHAMLRRIARIDHTVLVLNLLLLLSICLLPFSTALFAEYLTVSHGQHLAAAIYGGAFLLMSCCFFSIQRHVLQRRPELLHHAVSEEDREQVLRRNVVGLAPYALATALAAVSPYVTFAITAVIAAYYARPATTADVAREPAARELC